MNLMFKINTFIINLPQFPPVFKIWIGMKQPPLCYHYYLYEHRLSPLFGQLLPMYTLFYFYISKYPIIFS